MIYTDLTKKALKLAYEKHQGQYDRSNIPYIYHPIHVAEQMNDENSIVVALLHDVMEDTDTTEQELIDMGFGETIIKALKILTKPKDMDYLEYIKEVNKNDLAKKVKLADLNHNRNLSRLDVITEDDIKRTEKYEKAIDYLTSHENVYASTQSSNQLDLMFNDFTNNTEVSYTSRTM